MDSLVKSIRTFLFDVLGLLLPGFIALMLGVLPWLIPSHSLSSFQSYVHSLSGSTPILFLLLLGCYLLGHVIKVWAKYGYRLSFILLEKNLYQKLLCPMARWRWIARFLNTELGGVTRSFFRALLVCQPPSYDSVMEDLRRAVREKWHSRTGTPFPGQWHPLFKLAQATGADNHIPNEMSTYLAKYNFYRSMAFLFGLNFAYLAGLWMTFHQLSFSAFAIAFVANFLFWFSFHVKYKRYWTLCGNEALKVMYYFFFLFPKKPHDLHPEQSPDP
ncbi:MAG: hypothetical protein D6694_08480 [Gammaproteobacteria bacterium]|nr:MAG: hypothetical protein D6694_08480 [Gammaproteobacteria bacterium]